MGPRTRDRRVCEELSMHFYFLVIYSPTYIVHFETIANGTVFISFADWSLLLYSNMTDVCELLFYPISI